jgi:hypothetical protein
MRNPNRSGLSATLALALLAVALAGCATSGPQPVQTPEPAVVPLLPPAFPPQDIVGRWGLAAYHKDEDRARIELAAANQCKQPYIITLGPTGGVMMHLADQATPTELRLKGAPGHRTYVGPEGDPPGGMQDREVVSFDGRILILRSRGRQAAAQIKTEAKAEGGAETCAVNGRHQHADALVLDIAKRLSQPAHDDLRTRFL